MPLATSVPIIGNHLGCITSAAITSGAAWIDFASEDFNDATNDTVTKLGAGLVFVELELENVGGVDVHVMAGTGTAGPAIATFPRVLAGASLKLPLYGIGSTTVAITAATGTGSVRLVAYFIRA